MAGWELKEGKLDISEMSQDEFWNILKGVFSNKSRRTTSYKFCFFKAIIDNLFNCDMDYLLTFDKVFGSMGEIYWNLIYIHGISQFVSTKKKDKSKIELIIDDIKYSYNILEHTYYEFLNYEIKINYLKQVNRYITSCVVGAFFKDTKEKFYSFSKKEKTIKIHPQVYEYLVKHKYLVEKLNYYEWLIFLEKVNPRENAYALGTKLDEANKRVSLLQYKRFLTDKYLQTNCFYCGKKLRPKHIHVDHFIPWCYMKSDQLWNFVLACDKCNMKKSDKLPQYHYLENLISRNQKIQSLHQCTYVDNEFANYSKEKLKMIFNSALHNGLHSNWGA